jgi:hypothetical protein
MSDSEKDRPAWAEDERLDDELESIPEDGQATSSAPGPDAKKPDEGRNPPGAE